MRYRFKLTNFGLSEKNRFQNCLTVSNIQLASVVSDTFGKSSINIIEHILDNHLDRNIDIPSLIHGSLIKKIPELELAVDGVITETQAEKIKIIKGHYDALDLCNLNLESVILNLSKPYQKGIELLLSVPSINNIFTAIGKLSEIGTDMTVFPSAMHLCSWAGLTPTNNRSAGKKKSVRISRAGCYLKPLLVQGYGGLVISFLISFFSHHSMAYLLCKIIFCFTYGQKTLGFRLTPFNILFLHCTIKLAFCK